MDGYTQNWILITDGNIRHLMYLLMDLLRWNNLEQIMPVMDQLFQYLLGMLL